MQLRVIFFSLLLIVSICLAKGMSGYYELSGTVLDADSAALGYTKYDSLTIMWIPPVDVSECIGGAKDDSLRITFLVAGNNTVTNRDANWSVKAYLLPYKCSGKTNYSTEDSVMCGGLMTLKTWPTSATATQVTDLTPVVGNLAVYMPTAPGSWLLFSVTQTATAAGDTTSKDAKGFLYWECQTEH